MKQLKNLFWKYGTCDVKDDNGITHYNKARKSKIFGTIQIMYSIDNCGLENPNEWYTVKDWYYETTFTEIKS